MGHLEKASLAIRVAVASTSLWKLKTCRANGWTTSMARWSLWYIPFPVHIQHQKPWFFIGDDVPYSWDHWIGDSDSMGSFLGRYGLTITSQDWYSTAPHQAHHPGFRSMEPIMGICRVIHSLPRALEHGSSMGVVWTMATGRPSHNSLGSQTNYTCIICLQRQGDRVIKDKENRHEVPENRGLNDHADPRPTLGKSAENVYSTWILPMDPRIWAAKIVLHT